MGLFYTFFKDKKVKMIGVEAAGLGLDSKRTAASLVKGRVGVLHGSKSMVLQDKDGQIEIAHSVAAGLDYPGVGPEHSYYQKINRAEYVAVTDRQALQGFELLSQTEGIIPALEPAHAIAYLNKARKRFKKNSIIIVCLSGRGDKDVNLVSSIVRR
jgi:tryptophan synthase beta chain